MDRLTQHLVLVLVGAITLRVGLSDAYLAYVQSGFRPLLVLAAAVVLVLGIVGVVQERPGAHANAHAGSPALAADDPATSPLHDAGQHPGHDHGHHAPRVAWMLLLPVAVLLLVAPPALGAFTAARQAQQVVVPEEPPSPGIGPNDPGTDYRTLPLLNYSIRALSDDTSALEGRKIRLVGFVTPRDGGGWYVARIMINCCAADATAFTVAVDAPRGELAPDQWVEIIGTYAPPQPHPSGEYPEPVIHAETITVVPAPADTYAG